VRIESAKDAQKHAVSAADRGLIQLYYTPATRDAGAQIRTAAGALAGRLVRAIAWSDKARKAVTGATKALGEAFEGESAIGAIGKALQRILVGASRRGSPATAEAQHHQPPF
jgi:putative ATP-dependent endonuclease of OLD family